MKNRFAVIAAGMLAITGMAGCSFQQFNVDRAISGAMKGVEAITLSDDEIAQYVHQSVVYMDGKNPVAPASDPYAKRLAKLTAGLTDVGGRPLNFKVYKVKDVNAFACADGSVRVFQGLMDLMDDDEVLGVVGHEIGHVAGHHSRKQMKTALLASGARDVIGAGGGMIGTLSDSDLGAIGENLVNAKYSQKQETEADDYGYDFLKNNHKNPRAMVKAFKKLKSLEGDRSLKNSPVAQMFSTHPDTQARIDHMEKRCRADGY